MVYKLEMRNVMTGISIMVSFSDFDYSLKVMDVITYAKLSLTIGATHKSHSLFARSAMIHARIALERAISFVHNATHPFTSTIAVISSLLNVSLAIRPAWAAMVPSQQIVVSVSLITSLMESLLRMSLIA
jgi:hypothetical protein